MKLNCTDHILCPAEAHAVAERLIKLEPKRGPHFIRRKLPDFRRDRLPCAVPVLVDIDTKAEPFT